MAGPQRTLLLLLILLFFFYFMYSGGESPGQIRMRYGIMLDAGSTGSRVHVYQFAFTKDGPQIMSEVFEQLKPGLSSFAGKPQEAANSLKPLIDVAKESIPAELHRCTPIALKATAGLRLLPGSQSKDILTAVEKYLAATPFFLPERAVEIMDGSDEGVYAWMTVNFLLDRLGKQKKMDTVAIMDLGGGSTQIVFEPKGSAALKDAPKENQYDFRFGKHSYSLYQNSYLGFGLMEARKQIKSRAAASGASSCLPIGFEVDELKGALSSATCDKEVVGIFDKKTCPFSSCSFNGIFQPHANSFPSELYAFSYFYDRTETMNTPFPNALTLDAYSLEASRFCGKDLKEKTLETVFEQNPYVCLDLSFISSLLKDGYGIKDSQKILLTKKIKGYETGWCMGAMMKVLDEYPALCQR